MAQHDADIACVCETHTCAAGYGFLGPDTVLTKPRSVTSRHVYGGVAVIVRAQSQRVVSATIVSSCSVADVLVVDVRDSSDVSTRVITAYIPPAHGASDCQQQGCTGSTCDRSHTKPALQFIAQHLKPTPNVQDVVVLGDLNARVPRAATEKPSVRWKSIRQTLLQEAKCVLRNPVHHDGTVQATRTRKGIDTVLDIVLTAPHNKHNCNVTIQPEQDAISDHLSMLIDVQSATQQARPPADRYGMQSSVPDRLRTRWKLWRIDEHSQTVLLDAIKTGMRSPEWLACANDGAPSCKDDALDVVLTTAAVQAQLLVTVRELKRNEITPEHRALVRAYQRTRRAHVSDDSHPAVLAAHAALRASDATSKRRRRTARKINQRKSGTGKSALPAPPSQSSFPPTPRQIQQHCKTIRWQGATTARGHAKRDTRTIQAELKALEAGLRAKYNPEPAQQLQCDIAQLAQPIAPPSLEEIKQAVKIMSPSSACIGLPAALFKAAMRCDEFACAVQQLIADAWAEPSQQLPQAWTTVKTVLIHKKGDTTLLSNYRVIAIGTAMGKLVQMILDARVRAAVEASLDPCQFGFRTNLSAVQASLTFRSVIYCAKQQHKLVDAVFMDLTGAYPNTRHEHVLDALARARVDSGTVTMVARCLAQQQLFASMGNLHTEPIHQTIGITEGGAASPILYLVTVDPATSAVARMVDGNGRHPGLPTGSTQANGAATIPHVSYADDTATTTAPEDTQPVMDTFSEGFGRLQHKYNHSAGKTEGFFAERPNTVRDNPSLAGTPIRGTDTYEHLGVWCHKAGRQASAAVHVTHMAAKASTMVGRVVASRLAQLAPLLAMQIYSSELLPAVTYGAHIACDSMPQCVYTAESSSLRCIWAAPNCPLAVLRILGKLQSLHTRFQAATMATALKLLTLPAAHPARQQHRLEAALYWSQHSPTAAPARIPKQRKQPATLWLSSVFNVCSDMDAAQASLNSPAPSWVSTLRTALQSDTCMTTPQYHCVRDKAMEILASIDAARQRAAIAERPSLQDTAHVLQHVVSASKHTVLLSLVVPDKACKTRRQALSGWREWMTHRHAHRDEGPCVCCGLNAPGARYGVWHMYSECAAFEQQRMSLWNTMLAVAVRNTLCCVHDVSQSRQAWTFITLGIMPPGTDGGHAFNVVAADLPAQKRLAWHYAGLMKMANAFVLHVHATVTARLENTPAPQPPAHSQGDRAQAQQRVYYHDDSDTVQSWWLPFMQKANTQSRTQSS